jgi:ADP-ribose pyrophosphatase YjhB (NUDIX family)
MRTAVRAIIIKDNNLLVMHRNKFGNEYYALVGGGVDAGETPDVALVRELREEAGIVFANPRLVINENAGNMFGMQYIYLCDYVSGEPTLDPDSEEFKITALGQNLYTPMWLAISDLPKVNLLPSELKTALITGLQQGFPTEPLTLTVSS